MGSTGAETDSYKVGDRIFAKIRGYPHWPAQVTERRSGPAEEYCVAFYGSHEIAYVKPNMMCLYNEESIKKYAVGYSTKKKSSRNSILTFQKAMEECAANINFIPVDVEDEIEEVLDWTSDSAAAVDPLATKEELKTSAEEIDRMPRRGRPSKAVALNNINVTNNNESSEYSNGDQLSHDFDSDTQLITTGSDSDVEIPIIVTNVESLSDKIHAEEIQNSSPSVEELESEEVTHQQNGLNMIVSRSGRKIKPKVYTDAVVESPMTDFLKSTKGSSKPSSQAKRKASFDEPVEVKKIALEKEILTMPVRKPRKSVSISIDSEDGNLAELSDDTPQIIKVKRGATKKRFLATAEESASISWKEEAMRPLQDKLIKSCKRLETFQLEVENMSQSVITTPVRDKLAAASVVPVDISTAPLSQPVISKSMGAIARIVAGDSNKKGKLGGSTAKKSVGTSTCELKEAFQPENLQVSTMCKAEDGVSSDPDKDEIGKELLEESAVTSVSTVPDLVLSQSDKKHDIDDLHLIQVTEKASVPAHTQTIVETTKRVTFGRTVTKDTKESNKPISSTPLSISKRKTPVTPSSIMKKARILSPEKKKEDTSKGRSHLQRRVEVPMRYKDSTTSPKDNAKPGLTLKKPESVTNIDSPVSSRNSSDDCSKVYVNGSNGGIVDISTDQDNMNGLKSEPDSEEDENIDLTEEDFPDDQTKQRFKIQTKAKAVMETVVTLINSAMETDQKLDVALEMLVKLSEEGFVDKIMIKSYPDIVHVVRKMLHFVGNPAALKLTKVQKAEFPLKTEKIREQARKTLEGFKELMTTNTKPLAVLIMEEMRRQTSETPS